MTERTFKRPPLRHRHRHLVKQMFNGWPWIIWIAAAIAVMVLLPGGMHRVRFHGEAEQINEYVSPLENSRLKVLHVEMGDLVQAGQLVGELESTSLATQLLMDEASLMKTRDKVYSIRYDMENLKLEEAKTAAELKALEARWKRTEGLLAKKLLLEQEVEDLRPQIEAMNVVLGHYPALIEQLQIRLDAAEKDAAQLDDSSLQAFQVAQGRLISKTSGQVEEVLHRPGDVVETGDPVLRISNVSTSRIIAFLSEEERADVVVDDRCLVIPLARSGSYHGVVKSVTSHIRKLPVFTGFEDRELRGRRIVIELDDGETMIPGERVVVVPDMTLWEQWMGKRK